MIDILKKTNKKNTIGGASMHIENINNLSELPLTLNVSDVAGILGISINKAYELCNNERFPCIRVGKRRLIIPRPAFEAWMSNPCV